jgi:peptidoglycan/LPS O-acetylase OafA/YrhL
MVDLTSTEAHLRYLRTRVFGSLNGVRGLCIAAVVFHHTPLTDWGGITGKGFLGVDLFFVLSGFLIVTLLLRERDRTGTISLKKFYARRTLRIFPIYYLVLSLVLCFYVIAKPLSSQAIEYYHQLPFLLTYTSNWVRITTGNFGIMWSLATEEQFYAVWPIVEKLLRPLGVALMLAAVLIVNQLINFGVLDGFFETIYGGQPGLLILEVTFTPIALGVLLAHLLYSRRTFGSLYRVLGYPWSPVVVGAVLLALIAFWPGDLSGLGRLCIHIAMTLFLGSLVIREDHWARPALTFVPLAYMGMISYGIYVYHMLVLHFVRAVFGRLGWDQTGIAYFVIGLLACTAFAGLSYRFFEQPILKFKERFATDETATTGGQHAASPVTQTVA